MNRIPIIERGHSGSIDFQRRNNRPSPIVLGVYFIAVFTFIVVALVRLFQLTVVNGAYYLSLSDHNRVREIFIEAKRGSIFDRKGVLLAANTSPALDSASTELIYSKRTYYHPEALSSLIGYRQTADASDFKTDTCLNTLAPGEKTGKKGVERLYECQLRGMSGKKLIEVDAMGKHLNTLGVVDQTPGGNITLAVDSYLQELAAKALNGKKGAVIAIKPQTGEVLVLLSSPTYNPQLFEDSVTEKTTALLQDTDRPLFNRAAEGQYPPGSTFKIFMATAGLEEKAIKTDTVIEDRGVLQAGPLIFHNWYYLEYGKVEGDVDFYKAIQRSNDIYFYQLGAKLGIDKMKKWAELFGFHRKTGIGIDEVEGTLPSPFWKEDTLHEKWYLGDTYNLSIGQGYLTVTPLQVAMGTAVFANNGNLCRPQLLKLSDTSTASCTKLPVTKHTYESVREGMKRACETGGTGWPFFDFAVTTQRASGSAALQPEGDTKQTDQKIHNQNPKTPIKVGCKTGTAESHAASGKPDAWFTVFAPYEKPEIVMTVLVEEGGQGSDVAAPIAKEVLTGYFERSE